MSYRQVATLYRVGNTWIKMGQFQLPFQRDKMAHGNAWVAQQTAQDRACRGLFFVTPEDDPEYGDSRGDRESHGEQDRSAPRVEAHVSRRRSARRP